MTIIFYVKYHWIELIYNLSKKTLCIHNFQKILFIEHYQNGIIIDIYSYETKFNTLISFCNKYKSFYESS